MIVASFMLCVNMVAMNICNEDVRCYDRFVECCESGLPVQMCASEVGKETDETCEGFEE